MKNKTIYTSTQTGKTPPVKVDIVYKENEEVAAVHLFTKGGMFSYNSSERDYMPSENNQLWDASWFRIQE